MTDTPSSLLDRLCQRAEATEWERFVRLFTPLLHRWARRLGVEGDSEDLLQEVFLLLYRKLPEFHYDPCRSFRAWLWTVFRRAALAWLKQRPRHRLAADTLDALPSPDGFADAAEADYRRYLLGRALALVRTDFPETSWQVFWQTAVEGRPGVEVARAFGITPNAVYLIRARVLARLREELAGLDP